MFDNQINVLQRVLPKLDKDSLVQIALQQSQKIAELRASVERLSEQNMEQQAELGRLQKELAQAQRVPHRSTAPFRREEGEKEQHKGSPGRKKGHKGHYRQPSAQVNEEVEVPLDCCPHCSSTLEQLRSVEQIIEEIPRIELRVVRLRTYRGFCSQCEEEVYSTHPLQVSHASGAAKVQLGPRATGLVARLHHEYGLTLRKTSRLLKKEFQLPISPGGICSLEHRLGDKLQSDYEDLLEQARQADVLQGDETGWYVGETGHYLFVLTNEEQTLYDIRSSRARSEIEELLGADFDGIFVSDCLNMYDQVGQQQQKCYAHHLKAVKESLNILPKSRYLLQVKALLKDAIQTKKRLPTLEPPDYLQLCKQLEHRADELFPCHQHEKGYYEFHPGKRACNLKPAELQVAKRIARQRPHLFTFLYHEHVPATNNLSERQLRPAVIQRKLSCGNKTNKGAHTWKIIRSVCVSDNQQAKNFDDTIFDAIKRNI